MDASLLQLEGKSALVVGGGQGMGESTAKFLARAGCGVAIADLVKERADRVAAAVADLGRPSTSIVGDVLDDAQAKEIVERAERELGGLDALVTHRRPGLVEPDPRHDAGSSGTATIA